MKKLLIFIITLLIAMSTMICVAFAMDEQHVCEYVGGSYTKPGQCECGNTEYGYVLPKPDDTNLDYWIYEFFNEEPYTSPDIDGFYRVNCDSNGWYVNSNKYPPLSDNNGNLILDSNNHPQKPECCVEYFVEGNDKWNQHIVHIIITDPEVYFDGISLKSSLDEFKAYAIKYGLQIREVWSNKVLAQTGYYSIEFSNEKIEIDYDPQYYSNKLEITGPCFKEPEEIIITKWIIFFGIVLMFIPMVAPIFIIWIATKKKKNKIENIVCPVCKSKTSNDAIENSENACSNCKHTISIKHLVVQTILNILIALIMVVCILDVTDEHVIVLLSGIGLMVVKSILETRKAILFLKMQSLRQQTFPES